LPIVDRSERVEWDASATGVGLAIRCLCFPADDYPRISDLQEASSKSIIGRSTPASSERRIPVVAASTHMRGVAVFNSNRGGKCFAVGRADAHATARVA
jgi:hypothetical protein